MRSLLRKIGFALEALEALASGHGVARKNTQPH
jgi:hypothetical protein